MDLQATLAAGNPPSEPVPIPHHPLQCRDGELRLEKDGTFACDHARTLPNDQRTRRCIDSSIAILLFQILTEKEAS